MFRQIGLHQDRRDFRINSDGEVNARQFACFLSERLWILRDGDSVQVDDTEKAFVLALQGYPVAQCPQVITEVNVSGGLDAAENPFGHYRNG